MVTCGEENGVDGVLQKVFLEETLLEQEEGSLATLPNDDSVSCPAHTEDSQRDDTTTNVQITKVNRRKRLPEQYRSNRVTKKDNIEKNKDNEWKLDKNKKSSNVKKKCLVKLRIGLLKNCPETDLSNTAVTLESPVHTIMCQQDLSECDFINQLRSTFPELGENKPFEAYLADSTGRPYLANRMTPCELHKTFRSCKHKHFDFYIHLREHEDTLINIATTSLDDQTTKSGFEGAIPSEKDNKSTDEQDMSCMDSAAQSEEDEDDDWKPDDNCENEPQNNEEENSAALKSKKKIRKQRKQKFYSGSCKVCGYLFRSQTILIKHAQSHLDHQGCRCGVCGQQLESSGELKTHLETHQKLHQCDTCGRYFVSMLGFQRHVALHKLEKPKQLQLHLNNDKPYKCKICPQSFKFKVHLQEHTRKHTGEKPYCCDICGKSLISYRNLCQHKLIHIDEKNYSCQQCGNLFHSVRSLKRHEVIHTDREKKYLCDICSKSFFTKGELTMHQRIHAQLHFIKCTVCNKLLKGDLKKHMKIHTGEKTFICKECGKKFRCSHHLKRHANKHLEVKPFTCTVCGYTCERRDHLVSHMRTHTGDKPYKCTMCDKAFTQSHCLKTHVRKSHMDVDVDALV